MTLALPREGRRGRLVARSAVLGIFVGSVIACASSASPDSSDPVVVTLQTPKLRPAYSGYEAPPSGMVQASCAGFNAIADFNARKAAIDAYCAPIQNAGVFPSPGGNECWCSGGSDPCETLGCNAVDPACKCKAPKVCKDVGGGKGACEAPDVVLPDAGGLDAACDPTPKDQNSTGIPIRVNLGYQFPGGAAVCPQLVAIPFVGPALFSPSGGIGFSVDVQYDKSKTWKAVCAEEDKTTFGAGISANICGLTATGRWEKSTTDLAQHCVSCDPPPGACGAVACTDHSETQTRQVTITRSFDFPLGGGSSNGDTCEIGGGAPSRRWLDWLKSHLQLSASVGGGWNGRTGEMSRAGPGDCVTCAPCQTKNENNNIFLQASARAAISTPSWLFVSGSAYGELTGRAGVGRTDQTTTCTAPPSTCGGYDANASVTLRLGVSASVFGFSAGGSIGYTCRWSSSWSTCADAPPNMAECGWSQPTDP